MEEVIICGAGNAGRKALESLRREGKYRCVGFLDKNLKKGEIIQSLPVLGGAEDIEIFLEMGIRKTFVAIGNNFLRQNNAEIFWGRGLELISIVDPAAFVSCEASIGQGVLIMPNTYIGHFAKVEDLAVCQANCVISHYTHLGKATNIGYGAIISAYASVGDGSRVGIGAKVINNRKIGEKSLIGAGAVVTKDIPPNVVVFGVPARVIREIDLRRYDPNKD